MRRSVDIAEVDEALQKHTTKMGDARYFTGNSPSLSHAHTEEQARTIVMLCLLMDQPVTDIFSSDLFFGLLTRVIALENLAAPTDHVEICGRCGGRVGYRDSPALPPGCTGASWEGRFHFEPAKEHFIPVGWYDMTWE